MFLVKDRRLGMDHYVFTHTNPHGEGYKGDVIEGAVRCHVRRPAGGHGSRAGALLETRGRATALCPQCGGQWYHHEWQGHGEAEDPQEDRRGLDQRRAEKEWGGEKARREKARGQTPVSRAQRLERLRASFAGHGLDGLLVSQPESRYYLSDYTGHDLPPRDSAGYLLISATQALLLTDPRTTEQAQQQSPEYEVVTYGSGNRGPAAVAQAAAKLGLRRLGFESLHLPYAIWSEIRTDLSAMPSAKINTQPKRSPRATIDFTHSGFQTRNLLISLVKRKSTACYHVPHKPAQPVAPLSTSPQLPARRRPSPPRRRCSHRGSGRGDDVAHPTAALHLHRRKF